MPQPVDLLARLPGMAPGAELATALAGLDLAGVPNDRVVDVLRAQYRQLAHDHARTAATLLEVARATPYYGPDDPATVLHEPARRAAEIQDWAEGEIAAALTWTPGKAGWELARAHTLVVELPAVHAALAAGSIDRQKADVFAEYLDPAGGRLSREQVDALCARFLPPATGWTRRQLAARLLRAIIAIHPGAARDRYRRAVRARGVACHLDEDGAAVITASGLPPDEASAACARLDRLAATVKRAGHPGRLAQISTDLFLGMLDGRYHGLTEPEIIADLLGRSRPEDTPDTWTGADPGVATPTVQDTEAAASGTGMPTTQNPDAGPATDAASGTDIASGTDTATDGRTATDGEAVIGRGAAAGSARTEDRPRTPRPRPEAEQQSAPEQEPGPQERGPQERGPQERGPQSPPPQSPPPQPQPQSQPPPPQPPPQSQPPPQQPQHSPLPLPQHGPQPERGTGPQPAGPLAAGVRAGVEIRVGLATLLRLDERPGEIPGLGPVLADVARAAVAAQHRGAQWRFAITDPEGYLILAGVTRRRPGPMAGEGRPPGAAQGIGAGRSAGGIVELHLPAALLAALAADPTAADPTAADPTAAGPWAGVIADLAGQYARRHELLADLDGRPHARFARGALARHIRIRDRTCCYPGCTRPAGECELDHTRDHAAGGHTVRINIGPGCTRHHWFKTALGWRLHQPAPGHYVWRSPLGQTYRTRGEPIAPDLPEPLPGNAAHPAEGAGHDPEHRAPDGPILAEPLRRPAPPPPRPPPEPPPVDDRPPPF